MTAPDILNLAKEQTVRIKTNFVNSDGTEYSGFGYGFILSGKYLATCYHLTLPNNGHSNLANVEVVYNERNEGTAFKYDTVFATPNFKPESGQYDFSKHTYNGNDHATDFRILKLEKEITQPNFKIVDKQLVFDQVLYSLGNAAVVQNGNTIINQELAVLHHVIFYKENVGQQTAFIGCLGTAREGFSGSLVYDSDDNIVGMIQFGLDMVPLAFLDAQHNSGSMKDDLYHRIIDAYKKQQRLAMAIDIKFLMGTYMRGYM